MNYQPETCIVCGRETVSIISTPDGPMCYNCYSEKKNPSKTKKKQGHEEADIQKEFFKQVPLLFPTIPNKLLFAVPNGGSRNFFEAVDMKKQGTEAGVSDVICLIPKKGFASLCMEFKTKTGKHQNIRKSFNSRQKCAETSTLSLEVLKRLLRN